MTCTVGCCMVAKRADVVFSTRWAWSPDALYYVLVETRGVCEILCVLDAFAALCSPLGAVLQWKTTHWCCAFTVLPGPHTSSYVCGPAAFDPHTTLLVMPCPDGTISARVTHPSHTLRCTSLKLPQFDHRILPRCSSCFLVLRDQLTCAVCAGGFFYSHEWCIFLPLPLTVPLSHRIRSRSGIAW